MDMEMHAICNQEKITCTGSVATPFKCDGIFNDQFNANLLLYATRKKLHVQIYEKL